MSKYKQIDWVKFLQSQRYVDTRPVSIYRHDGRIYVELRPQDKQRAVWVLALAPIVAFVKLSLRYFSESRVSDQAPNQAMGTRSHPVIRDA